MGSADTKPQFSAKILRCSNMVFDTERLMGRDLDNSTMQRDIKLCVLLIMRVHHLCSRVVAGNSSKVTQDQAPGVFRLVCCIRGNSL